MNLNKKLFGGVHFCPFFSSFIFTRIILLITIEKKSQIYQRFKPVEGGSRLVVQNRALQIFAFSSSPKVSDDRGFY